MQQMQEPERRTYSGEYQGSPADLGYGSRQFSEEYTGEGEQPQYTTNEWGQQKLHPTSRSGRAIALVLMIITAATLGISIALFTQSTVNMATGLGPPLSPNLSEGIIASFGLSLLMMLLTIAAFVASIINLLLTTKKFRRSR